MQAQRALTPWIKTLILSYGEDEGMRDGGLQAHVVRVGNMSQSQTLDWDGPVELLYLSDEHVQIPALLTASAWENLQDEEDLECFQSLVDHTVCITDYKLLFHRSSELSRSWFVLSVGQLGTKAVVRVNKSTPCATSLPLVRNKIRETWRAASIQEDTQISQSQCDLSELLGEWHKDCLQTEVERIRQLLTVTPQPSTSTMNPPAALPDTCPLTGWEIDRVRYKGSKRFDVPVNFLLIPDPLRQPNILPQTDSENVGPSENLQSPESTNPQMSISKVTTKPQSVRDHTINALEDGPVVMSGPDMSPISSPWDMCLPPSNTSSNKSSLYASPILQSPIFTESNTNLHPVHTSTQLSAHSNGTQSVLPTEPSLFPPYQRPPASAPTPSSISSKKPANALSRVSDLAEPNSSTTTQATANKQLNPKCKKFLRKRGASPPEEVVEVLEKEEEEQVSRSPPSWMLESLSGSTSEQSISQTPGPPGVQLTPARPCVHADGTPFSYTYEVRGQDLQDLSRFTVGQDLLHWAVKYLLRPEHCEQNSTGDPTPEAEDSVIIIP